MESDGGPGDVDSGQEGVSPREPQDAWRIGAGIEPDEAAEGEAAVREAVDSQQNDSSPTQGPPASG